MIHDTGLFIGVNRRNQLNLIDQLNLRDQLDFRDQLNFLNQLNLRAVRDNQNRACRFPCHMFSNTAHKEMV
jgi:hypothetical protein